MRVSVASVLATRSAFCRAESETTIAVEATVPASRVRLIPRMRVSLVAIVSSVLAACSTADRAEPDAAIVAVDASELDATPRLWGERCDNGIDDDLDGLADEDCIGLFGGLFAPTVASDPALVAIETASTRPLAVLQTYHSLTPLGIARTTPDLARIFARGQVAHLNVEPSGYTAQQYAAPTTNPLANDLTAMGNAIASALGADPDGRVILTFGAEMNGDWVDWGCLPAAQYIALYRAAHVAINAALAGAQIDRRRVRWAYGPNNRSSASCGSAAGYYPGHAYVDLLGMSAYRAASDSVDATVIAPMAALFDALAYPTAWRRDRFVVLQTGARDAVDRDAWITALFARLTTDERAAGIIYFDASADWAIATNGTGWSGLTSSLADAPLADRALAGVFTPHFWDVPYGHPAFLEIQALRDSGITSGCAQDPSRFCPDDPVRASDAGALLSRAFPGASITLPDPVTESELAAAVTALGGTPPPAGSMPATRARAAIIIAHGADLRPATL